MSKKKLIIIIVLMILIIAGIIIYLLNINKNSNEVAINNTLKYEVAEELYEAVAIDECTNISIDEEVSSQNMDDEILLYLIFGQMKKDGLLNDTISLKDFSSSAKKILGEIEIPEEINNYVYDGYVYNLENDEITREKYNCGDKKYVSKLYGYSTNETQIQLDVKVGYIENNNVYDLNGQLLGEYEEETLSSLLDNSTTEVFSYNNDYILESISLK